jgi:hypothetical protein
MKTTYDTKYTNQEGYGYKLVNKENEMWYVGIHKGSPEDPENPYITSSKNVDLLEALNLGKIETHIIKADDYANLEIWEKNYLLNENAAINPKSYNLSNGISQKNSLPRNMKPFADLIIKNQGIFDCKKELISMNKKKGKLTSSALVDTIFFQVRDTKLIQSHVNDLASMLDENPAVNEIEQKLIVVILKDRVFKGRKVDLLIGGAHTYHAFEKSKIHSFMPVLYIDKSVHEDWSDDEIQDLGLELNPRSHEIRLETHLDDIVKRIYDYISFSNMTMKSQTIVDLKNNWCKNSKEKRNVTTRVNKMLEDEYNRKNQPANSIDYTVDEEMKILKDKIKKYNKKPYTHSRIASTGKFALGDYLIKIINNYYSNKKNIKNVHIVMYHPNITAYEKYKKDYEKGFLNFKKLLKKIEVDVKIEEMPMTREVA